MKKSIFLLFMIWTVVLQAQTVHIPISKVIKERDGKQYYLHTVERGQTVYSIAKAYHVGIKEIYFENPNAKQGIIVGQTLWIPTVNKETEITKEVKQSDFDFFYHIAASHETLKHISSIYIIPERYIRLANPGIQEPLREGEYVKVPVESAFPILDGHPVQSEEKANPVEENARKFSAAEPNADVIPKYKPTVDKTKEPTPVTVSTTNALHKNIPEQANSKTEQVSFNPEMKVIPDFRHVVVRSETLEKIAKKYHITVHDLKAVNPGLIMAEQGQRLRLPITAKVPGYHNPASANDKVPSQQTVSKRTETPVATASQQKKKQQSVSGFYFHKVKKKETLYSISRKYGVTLNDLYQNNPGLSTQLRIGQTLKVPKKKIKTDYLVYSPPSTIRLRKLARLYLISYSALKQDNPLLSRKVYAGQTVKIPVGNMAWIIPEEANEKPNANTMPKPEVTPFSMKKCRKHARFNQRTYNVALMIPLYLEEMDSLDKMKFMSVQQNIFRPFRFVKFLEGALMAVDSLQQMGMHIHFYIYDVDDRLTKTAEVLSKPELRKMDLIIGPFFSTAFKQVALFANQFNIPIVNPLTYREAVTVNYNKVIKIKPGISFQPDLIANIVSHNYKKDKVFVIAQTSYKDADRIIGVQNSVISTIPETIAIPNAQLIGLGNSVAKRDENFMEGSPLVPYSFEGKTIDPELLKSFPNDSSMVSNNLIHINYLTDSLHPIEKNASVLRNNLVIIYSSNKAFIMDVINRLTLLSDTFNIQVMGLPLWERIDNPDYRQLNHLQTLYPASEFFNYKDDTTLLFVNRFKEKYFSDPESYGIQGFDITWFFARTLFDYGKNFTTCLPEIAYKGISTTYRFKQCQQNQKSFENSYWNILQIKNNKLIKLPDFLRSQGD